MFKYRCPNADCEGENMYQDATAYWDVKSQSWLLSDGSIDDRNTIICGDCGDEFPNVDSVIKVEVDSDQGEES